MFVEELENSREWESFLEASPDSTFYHSLKWGRIIQHFFSYSPLYLTIKDANGILVGICPGFITRSLHVEIYNSMPHSDYGGPAIAKHCVNEASISLRNYLDSLHSKDIVYARLCLTEPTLLHFFRSKLGHCDKCKGVMRIDLKKTPCDFIWNRTFSGNRRRKIRLVERKGFEVWKANTRSDLRGFYELYSDNMERIHADTYPYRFLETLWDTLHPENLHIWLVGRNKAAAGVLFFKHKQESYAAYVGIDREQRVHGLINYLWWRELQKAEGEGRRYVCLGSTPSDPTDPYHVQKKSLGGSFRQQELVWYPVSPIGCILSQIRAKTITTWRNIRKLMPIIFRQRVESQLERL